MKPFIRKRGKWLHVVYFNKGSTRPIEKSLKIPNTKRGMAEAKLHLPDYEKKELKDYNPNGKIKLSEAFRIYKQGELKEGTYSIRKFALKHFINACGDKTLMSIEEGDGIIFKEYLKKNIGSANSRNIYSSHLKTFFNDLIKSKLLSVNPILISKRQFKPVQIIPNDDFDKILSYLKAKHWEWYFLIAFLKYTGMRKSDALALTWECIRFDDNVIDTESIKTEYHYQIPLTRPLKELFQHTTPSTGLIFNMNKRLNFWDRCQQELILKRHYTIHEIRKTFISTMLQAVKLDKVAKLVGHKSPVTTYKYYTKFETQLLGQELDATWEKLGKSNGNYNGNSNLRLINPNKEISINANNKTS